MNQHLPLCFLTLVSIGSLLIAAEDAPASQRTPSSSSERVSSDMWIKKHLLNPALSESHSSGHSKKMEPLSWSISRALWGLMSGRSSLEDLKKYKIAEAKAQMRHLPPSNRHRRFNRPPFGKVVIGAPNVNHPGLFSSSAQKPVYMGCSGTPCTLPPNAFYGPSKKWAPSIWSAKTPPLPHHWTPLPPLTLPYNTIDFDVRIQRHHRWNTGK